MSKHLSPAEQALRDNIENDIRTAKAALEIGDLEMVKTALQCAISHLK